LPESCGLWCDLFHLTFSNVVIRCGRGQPPTSSHPPGFASGDAMSDRNDWSTETYTGGLSWIGGGAPRPLVRVRFDTEGIRVTPSFGPAGLIAPNWHCPWLGVVRAERARALLLRTQGVTVYSKHLESPFTFWYTEPRRILEALARRGIPIDDNEHRVGWLWRRRWSSSNDFWLLQHFLTSSGATGRRRCGTADEPLAGYRPGLCGAPDCLVGSAARLTLD
jgi:hypothetical protein